MGACLSLASINSTNSQRAHKTNHLYEYALRATIGQRREMQDRNTICVSLPKHPLYSLFGIFDGFNGADAASYFSKNLIHLLDELTDIENDAEIIDSINKMDALWRNKGTAQCDTASDYNVNAGNTFVFALVKKSKIKKMSNLAVMPATNTVSTTISTTASTTVSATVSTTASRSNSELLYDLGTEVRVFWAGDSRAMLINDQWKYSNLTTDHHCDSETEGRRIKNANGEIINNRINGICAISRCFGCNVMKNNELLAPNKQKMISDAECTKIICYENDTLLLFCDGLIEKWNEKELVTNYKYHYNYQSSLLHSLDDLCEQAIDDGSTDNISVIAVRFK